VKRGKIKNVAASVRQRLLNEARASGRPFNELLQYFAMERFLYRLSESPHVERFVLKGALMLAAWVGSRSRSTKDIDLLGHVANDVETIVDVVKEICRQEIQPDGLAFDPASVTGDGSSASTAGFWPRRFSRRSRGGGSRSPLDLSP